jgi:GNAT superfamily N-acetyltransferase
LECLLAKAEQLEHFLDQLLTTISTLKQKGLTPELQLCSSDRNFQHEICKTVTSCLISAYGIKPCAKDIGPAYLAVVVREEKSASVVACALADFRPYPSNEFVTRMEAVHKEWQRQQIGTALFHYIELSVQFLMQSDWYVRCSMSGETQCTLKAYVDNDAPEWHSEMMQKLGFEEEEDPYEWRGDIGFSKVVEHDHPGIGRGRPRNL